MIPTSMRKSLGRRRRPIGPGVARPVVGVAVAVVVVTAVAVVVAAVEVLVLATPRSVLPQTLKSCRRSIAG